MSFVPGYNHDVFVSYAHGDDRGWVDALVNRLQTTLNRRLGSIIDIWIDKPELRHSRDFRKEIPDSVTSSGILLVLASPTYIRSDYCINVECRAYQETLPAKQSRFKSETFRNELFIVRSRILPIDGNLQWELFKGATDIDFCDADSDTYTIGSPQFESAFRRLTDELGTLLRTMHNDSTPVFLYPHHPSSDILEARSVLTRELVAQNYRVLPDSEIDLPGQLRQSALSVFLLGEAYDNNMRSLAEVASNSRKPWVVWHSPSAEATRSPETLGLSRYLDQLESRDKTDLNTSITISKLKEEVLALLGPVSEPLTDSQGKPRVYIVFDRRNRSEAGNAGLIKQHFDTQAHFEFSDDPLRHNIRLVRSDGVLLIWGKAEMDWCTRELEQILVSAGNARSKGLCVFDPEETKKASIQILKNSLSDLYIAEEFGERFIPDRLETFFQPLRPSGG